MDLHEVFEKFNDDFLKFDQVENKSNIEFHFNAPLPEWVKVNNPAWFEQNSGVQFGKINRVNELGRFWITTDDGEEHGYFSQFNIAPAVGPAKRQVTFDYLAKLMPFAVKEKHSKKITTILSVHDNEVWIAGKGYLSFSLENLCELYTLPDGSEIGEYVKCEVEK